MISEGHDVETASQMVDTMQSLRVLGGGGGGGVYLAFRVAPATEGKYSASLKVSDHLDMRLPSTCSVDLNK